MPRRASRCRSSSWWRRSATPWTEASSDAAASSHPRRHRTRPRCGCGVRWTNETGRSEERCAERTTIRWRSPTLDGMEEIRLDQRVHVADTHLAGESWIGYDLRNTLAAPLPSGDAHQGRVFLCAEIPDRRKQSSPGGVDCVMSRGRRCLSRSRGCAGPTRSQS